MRSQLTRRLVLSALFAALICVATFVVKIPVPGSPAAYMNAGDAIIYTAGVALAGPWAAAAAGIGSAFADLIVGAPVYAPATLVIKAAMGFIVGAALHGRKASWRYLLFMIIASLVMVAGYGIYETFLYGLQPALAYSPFNLIQAAFGVAIGVPLAILVRRIMPETWIDKP